MIFADDDAAWSISLRLTESMFSISRVEEEEELDEDELEEMFEEEDVLEAAKDGEERVNSDSFSVTTASKFSSLATVTTRKASNFPSLFIFMAATLAAIVSTC